MSVTYGFYNSVNGDRKYNAVEFSRLFEGIFTDGIFRTIGDSFEVLASNEDMTITVGTGRAWFNNTWTDNDNIIIIDIPRADLLYDRFDAIVLEVATNINRRENSIKHIQGVPTSQPNYPNLINSDGIYQYPLAYILVRNGSSMIIDDDIYDYRGTEDCPYLRTIVDEDLNFVPSWREINNYPLTADITLNASDVNAESTSYSLDLYYDMWSGSGPYTQSIGLLDIKRDTNAEFGVNYSALEYEEREEVRNALLSVHNTVDAPSLIVFTADGDKPTINIPITVIIFP